MSKKLKWLSLRAVMAIYEQLLAEHGGKEGIRDEGLLESALAAPLNRFNYGEKDIFILAAAYAHAVSRNHPFYDGNKRVSLAVAGVFLELNGYRLNATEADAVQAILGLAQRKMSESEFAEWLRLSSVKISKKRFV